MYTVQELRSGYVVTEELVDNQTEAISLAKEWHKSPINDGDTTRVIWEGDLVYTSDERAVY